MKDHEKKILEALEQAKTEGKEVTAGELRKQCFLSNSAVHKFLSSLVANDQLAKRAGNGNTQYYMLKNFEATPVMHVPEEHKTRTAANDTLLSCEECWTLLSVKKTKFYEMIKEKEFPKPYKIGRFSRWKESEILAYRESLRIA